MLLDIFSSFDPATHFMFSLPLMFWIFPILIILTFTSAFWINISSSNLIIFNPINFIYSQFTRTKGNNLKGLTSLITPLFLFLIFLNLLGLMPYIFSSSSHLILTLSFGFPLWLSLIISSLIFNPSSFAASLLPSGAPAWLNPALVIIESISILVRPLTLSFRLAANMSAGHIVLGLINMYTAGALNSSSISFISLILISTGYTLFETGICFVQAYIFCLLLSLYSDEHTD